jgi:hypothetical protein
VKTFPVVFIFRKPKSANVLGVHSVVYYSLFWRRILGSSSRMSGPDSIVVVGQKSLVSGMIP